MCSVWEKYNEQIREEGREEGRKEGRKEGREEGRKEGIINAVKVAAANGISIDQALNSVSVQFGIQRSKIEEICSGSI